MKKKVLFSVLSNTNGYSERLALILGVGASFDRHVLISNPFDINTDELEVVSPGEKLSAIKFCIFARKKIVERAKANKDTVFIVHEYLLGVTNFLLKWDRLSNVHRVTSLYSVEFRFLFKLGWRADAYSAEHISMIQNLKWLKISAKTSFQNLFAWSGSNVIVGNSQDVVDDGSWVFSKRKTFVLPTSVNLDVIQADRKWPRKNKELSLVFVSRINPPKGHGMLLEAITRLRKQGEDISLTLIGGYWPFEEAWLERLISVYKAKEFCTITGNISFRELTRIVKDHDIFVFPSFYEGSPRALKEAMAMGVSSITSDLAGCRSLDPTKEALVFFKRGNVESLCNAILQMISLKKSGGLKENGEKCRLAAEEFSREKTIIRQLHIYEEIINKKLY